MTKLTNLIKPNATAINIKNYGAVGDGVTDDTSAFKSFTNAYQGANVSLWMPPGTYLVNATNIFAGINDLTIFAYGATFVATGGGSNFGTSGPSRDQTATNALIQTTGAFTNSLTLVSGGDASKFSIGNWIAITALDMQGTGFPPNHYYYQFTKILNISGSTISILDYTKYSYSSAYPWYNSGDVSTSNANAGGPATIYVMPSGWQTKYTIYGLTFSATGGTTQAGFYGRSITYIDCLFQSPIQPPISWAQSIVFDSCHLEATTIEVDKDVECVAFHNCDMTYTVLLHQSPCPDRLIVDNCTIGTISGTPKNTTLLNSFIGQLVIGTRSLGVSETLFMSGCNIPSVSDYSSFTTQPYSDFTSFTNGVLKLPKSVRWTHGVPGARFVNTDTTFQSNHAPPEFIILDLSTDGTPGSNTGNTYFYTTLDPSFNFSSTYPAADQNCFMVMPCANITAQDCTGSLILRDLCQNTSGSPMYSYSKCLFTGNRVVNVGDVFLRVYGLLVAIKINVIRAYGSAIHLYNDFGGKYDSSFNYSDVSVTINLNHAGLRVMAPGGNTGAQAGDTLPTFNTGDWLTRGFSWKYDTDISGSAIGLQPIVQIETIVDPRYIGYKNIQAPPGAGGHGY